MGSEMCIRDRSIVRVVELPLHIVVVPFIPVGEVGGDATVILRVLSAPEPHELFATTLNLPLLVGVNVTDVPVPEGVPPPLYFQV